jgi:hypothetical protein
MSAPVPAVLQTVSGKHVGRLSGVRPGGRTPRGVRLSTPGIITPPLDRDVIKVPTVT